jgi:Domain of unknown function (DUF4112)
MTSVFSANAGTASNCTARLANAASYPISMSVRTKETPMDRDALDRRAQAVARLDALVKLLGSAFVIAGTNIRVGLDGLIGLLPIAGDLISSMVSSYIVWEARQLGVPRWMLARMMLNVAIDTAVGSVQSSGTPST